MRTHHGPAVALAIAVTATLVGTAVLGQAEAPRSAPGRVTRYDFATRDDLLFAHLVAPLLQGDVPDWPLLKGLADQLGAWINPFLDARRIADVITTAMPLEGQPLTRLDRLVADCARTLGVDKP